MLSRREARRLIAAGRVWVHGQPCRVQGRLLDAGAHVRIEAESAVFAEPAAPAPPPTPAGLDAAAQRAPDASSVPDVPAVLWAAEGLIAVSKPSRVPTEPTRQGASGVMSHRLAASLRAQGQATRFLAAVHRLDTETSGVVLFATSPRAADLAGEAFRAGRVERDYFAVVEGAPAFAFERFTAPIARDPRHPRRFLGAALGKPAQTEAIWMSGASAAPERSDAATASAGALLHIRPLSGRTHQIRVHLTEAGHPIWGDVRYGARAPGPFGLHAARLRLTFADGRVLCVGAPLPPAFLEAARAAGVDVSDAACRARAWAGCNRLAPAQDSLHQAERMASDADASVRIDATAHKHLSGHQDEEHT